MLAVTGTGAARQCGRSLFDLLETLRLTQADRSRFTKLLLESHVPHLHWRACNDGDAQREKILFGVNQLSVKCETHLPSVKCLKMNINTA